MWKLSRLPLPIALLQGALNTCTRVGVLTMGLGLLILLQGAEPEQVAEEVLSAGAAVTNKAKDASGAAQVH